MNLIWSIYGKLSFSFIYELGLNAYPAHLVYTSKRHRETNSTNHTADGFQFGYHFEIKLFGIYLVAKIQLTETYACTWRTGQNIQMLGPTYFSVWQTAKKRVRKHTIASTHTQNTREPKNISAHIIQLDR